MSRSLISTLLLSSSSLAFQVFPPDSVSSYPKACGSVLSQDITACNPLVPVLTPGTTYDRSTLDKSCSTDCSIALSSWYSQASSACSNVTYTSQYGYTQQVSSLLGEINFNYNQTCRKDGGQYCNLVLGSLAASNVANVSTCNRCALLQIKATAESPYGDGPLVSSQSIYQSYTKSCSYTGFPLATSTPTSTLRLNRTSASGFRFTNATTTATPRTNDTSCSTGTRYSIKAGDTCESIAASQGIATWWLLLDNGLQSYCANFPKNGTLCLENSCKTQEVKPGDSCRSVAASNNITVTQLQTWNPWIDLGCYNFNNTVGTHICVDQPGTKYVPPDGDIGSSSAAATSVPVPPDIAVNTTTNCGLYYRIKPGDNCQQLVLEFGLTTSDFQILNPSVNSNCSNLYANESYCVAPVGDINSYPGSPFYALEHPTATAPCFTTLPSATYVPILPLTTFQLAAGTNTSCYNYRNGNDIIYGFPDASDCSAVAWQYNITLDQLHAWNPSLQTASPKCTFDPHLRYCVWHDAPPDDSVPSVTSRPVSNSTTTSLARNTSIATPTSSTTAGTSTSQPVTMTSTPTSSASTASQSPSPSLPSPTQPHSIPRNCASYSQASTGSTCSTFSTKNNITTSQLYAWNSVLGANGTHCDTSFQLGVYYCVGVTIPTPTQNNSIPTNCDVYAEAHTGDGCADFAKKSNVTTDDFYEWNSVLGANGADCEKNFQAGMYYCVGVNA